MGYAVSVDCGGTFTEAVVFDEMGNVNWAKTPSTPSDYSLGIMNAVNLVSEQLKVSSLTLMKNTQVFGVGTTVGINAIATRVGGLKTGLITTKGHEDAIIIGRRRQMVAGLPPYELFDIVKLDKPTPLVPRNLIKGITERIDFEAEEIVPLDKQEALSLVDALKSEGVEGIAISLLWSHVNPSHELELKKIIEQRHPGLFLTCSSELVPVIGEYERTATTVINTYLTKIVSRFASTVSQKLEDLGFANSPLIMSSTGGSIPADQVHDKAVYLLISGLVGGVLGSIELGKMLGHRNIITSDVGGTSFEVSIINDGELQYKDEPVFEKYQVSIPVVDVTAIGAAGGSIAWVEKGTNLLKVGPRSAGAYPGPVAYGIGGTEPTVTDADIILNRIDTENFLGGRIKLSREKALEAMKEKVAVPLGMDVVEASAGVIEIVDSQMADLMRRQTIMRGYDPREFVLFAFGGAGPGHVGAYGQAVRVKFAVIPFCSSAFSAFGIGRSDVLHVKETSLSMPSPFDIDKLNSIYSKLENDVLEMLRKEGFSQEKGTIDLSRWAKIKFKDQIHEFRTPVPLGTLTDIELKKVISDFESTYEQRYGKGAMHKEVGVEFSTYQVYGTGKIVKSQISKRVQHSRDPVSAKITKREVYWKEHSGFVPTDVFDRQKLQVGNVVEGPAIIEAPDTTIVIHPHQSARVDEYLNIILSWSQTT